MNTETTDITEIKGWVLFDADVRDGLHRMYKQIARRRSCAGGACVAADRRKRNGYREVRWIPALALPVMTAALGADLPGWIWMWLLVLALFLGAKWLTIWPPRFGAADVSRRRLLGYILLWPGMDAPAFLGKDTVPKPVVSEWFGAAGKTALGAALLWAVTPLIGASHPLLTGWIGMVGMVFLLHFGLFHVLSICWRSLGINARPVMRSPGGATSLGEFWGRRWNAAFADWMHELCFRPLAAWIGARAALIAVFIVSGALHEIVISLPARGGYGLPMLYFAVQALGLLFERRRAGRVLRLGAGPAGWCFVALVAGVPALWLFHPDFIRHVILPMLHAVGAYQG